MATESAIVFTSPILERWRRWDMGARQRVNEFWLGVASTDPMFERVVMCIELVFGGDVVVRIASRPITTISSIDGTRYFWKLGLMEEPDIEHLIEIGNPAAQARSMTVTVPTSVLDVSGVLERGGMLAGIAEVSLARDGDDYDNRLVLLRGDMSGGVDFGAVGESLQVQIVDPRETQALKIPRFSVTSDRWSLAQDSAVGIRYPVILNGYPKVPCLRVLDDHGVTGLKYLVCGAGRELQIDATYVNGDVAAGVYLPATETNDRDAAGTPCKTIDFTASAGPWEDNDSVYADVSLRTGEKPLSVTRILHELLQGYTGLGNLGLNPDLFSAADVRMPGVAPLVLINASGEEAVDVLEWIEGTFLTSFPMVNLLYEGRGLGPVVVDRRVGPAGEGISGRLVGGQLPLLERASGPTETPKSKIYNEFELRYGANLQNDTYDGVVQRTSANSRACELSERMTGGRRPMTTIDSPYIHTDSLANWVIDWLVAHFALPSYDVVWRCLPSIITRYRPGMNVLYTDSNFRVFSACPATITGITYSRGESKISLRVWHPAWRQLLLGSV